MCAMGWYACVSIDCVAAMVIAATDDSLEFVSRAVGVCTPWIWL